MIQIVERVNHNTSCYRWKIKRFSQVSRQKGTYVVSREFSAIDSKVKWQLMLNSNGLIQEKSDFMLLGIRYYGSLDAKVCVEVSIVNIDNEVLESLKLNKELQLITANKNSKFQMNNNDWCFRFMVNRSDVEAPENRILADDCLTISFDITFHDPIVELPISSKEYQKVTRQNMLDDFGQLLENGKFSDVKFVVGDKEIHVHKAILASRSPVFDAMFQREMQETKKTVVVIVDIDSDVMKELFRFIYTDTVANIDLIASDLLVAADKYCIEQLKALCEKSLLNSLSDENVLQRLRRAEQYNLGSLKKQIVDFIVKYCTRVVRKDEFALLPPHLMCEITRAMAPKVNAD